MAVGSTSIDKGDKKLKQAAGGDKADDQKRSKSINQDEKKVLVCAPARTWHTIKP